MVYFQGEHFGEVYLCQGLDITHEIVEMATDFKQHSITGLIGTSFPLFPQAILLLEAAQRELSTLPHDLGCHDMSKLILEGIDFIDVALCMGGYLRQLGHRECGLLRF